MSGRGTAQLHSGTYLTVAKNNGSFQNRSFHGLCLPYVWGWRKARSERGGLDIQKRLACGRARGHHVLACAFFWSLAGNGHWPPFWPRCPCSSRRGRQQTSGRQIGASPCFAAFFSLAVLWRNQPLQKYAQAQEYNPTEGSTEQFTEFKTREDKRRRHGKKKRKQNKKRCNHTDCFAEGSRDARLEGRKSGRPLRP